MNHGILGKTHVSVALNCLNQCLNTGWRRHLKIEIIVKSLLTTFFMTQLRKWHQTWTTYSFLKKVIYWNQKIDMNENTQNFLSLQKLWFTRNDFSLHFFDPGKSKSKIYKHQVCYLEFSTKKRKNRTYQCLSKSFMARKKADVN